MDHETVKKCIIINGGFITLTDLKRAFEGEQEEILDVKLTFLVEKRQIKKADYRTAGGSDTLYYIPE